MAQGRHNNNFDLLRLIAAAQVLICHAGSHLGVQVPAFVSYFPGVPVFFVISGYLVSQSYERTSFTTYCVNRALRIFPGLWACLAVSIGIAAIYGFSVGWPWIAAQATLVQFYNPQYLRDFGVGVLNGSLWTIPVELQFYAALPFVYWLLKSNRALLAIIALGAIVNAAFVLMPTSMVQKAIGETLPIYLYLFLIGVLLQRNPAFVARLLTGRLPLWLALYLAVAVTAGWAGLANEGNFLNPIQAGFLALLVVSAGFARAVPLKADLSYGLYLYHMPVVNAFIESGRGGNRAALAVAAITLALACASWFLIERPALRLKRHFATQPALPAPLSVTQKQVPAPQSMRP